MSLEKDLIIGTQDEEKIVKFLKDNIKKLDDESIIEIFISINDEEKRIKALKELKDVIDPFLISEIIISISNKDRKIELLREMREQLDSYSISAIITSIDSENERTILLKEFKEKLSYGAISQIINSISDEETKIDILRNIQNKSADYSTANIISNIKDEKRRIELFNEFQENLGRRSKLRILRSLKKDTKINLVRGNVFEYIPKSNALKIPISFYILERDLSNFDDANFSYFNAEINYNTIANLGKFPDEEWRDFLKFAKTLGCFSDDKMLNKSGNKTEVVMGQKATTTLRDMLRVGTFNLGEFHELFDSMPMNVKPNQNFLKFISHTDGKKRFENLEMLINLNSEYPGMFTKVMSDFDSAKKYRETLNDIGKPINVPWEEALKKFYSNVKYTGITDENRDIAKVFAEKGLSQEIFERASQLRQEADEKQTPHHILGKHLKEESILETIERIQAQTEEELESSRRIVENLYSKKFTYEWLSKNDPQNSIMGLFVNCCGSITSEYYGKDIARASVIAPDVQNLVVRDSNGNIISKGTMYVNKEQGYAVINDFELNRKYRNREQSSAGKYNVDENSIDEQEREQVFNAFQRGLQAFIEEYDAQNPNNPIKQVNIGMGYNRLKRQVERFKKATENLKVPFEYSFEDAEDEQYILYKRGTQDKKQEENEEIEL